MGKPIRFLNMTPCFCAIETYFSNLFFTCFFKPWGCAALTPQNPLLPRMILWCPSHQIRWSVKLQLLKLEINIKPWQFNKNHLHKLLFLCLQNTISPKKKKHHRSQPRGLWFKKICAPFPKKITKHVEIPLRLKNPPQRKRRWCVVKPPEQIIRKLPSPSRSRSLQVLVLARHLQSLLSSPRKTSTEMQCSLKIGAYPPGIFRRFPAFFFLAWILWGFQPFSFQGSIYSYKKSAEKLYWRKKGDLKRRFKFPKTPPHCHLEKHYRSIRLSEWMWRSRWSCGVKSRRLCLFYYVTTLRKNFHSDSIPACHCAGIELKEMAHWNTMQK